MNSDDQGDVFVGVCFIYTSLAIILFTIIVSSLIGRSLESQGVLLFLIDIFGPIISLLFFFCLIIAPLIGSILIVRQTKDLSIGFRSIKYFFLTIFSLIFFIIFFFLYESIVNPIREWFAPLAYGLAFGTLFLLLLAGLLSLFVSLLLLKLLARTSFFSFVKDTSDNSH